MKPLTMKQSQRIERKKKKIAAFLEIAKLNDKDREVCRSAVLPEEPETRCACRRRENSEPCDCEGGCSPAEEPSRKRARKQESSSPPAVPEPVPVGPRGKPLLSGQEFADLKRRLRERKNALKSFPFFRLKQAGELASVQLKEEDRTPLFLSDIQHLLLYSILVNHAPFNHLGWCHVDKARNISHTVFLLIEGLSLYEFQAHESCFPVLSQRFSTKVEVITPSAYVGSFVEELALVPLAHSKESRLIWKYGSIEKVLRAEGEMFKVMGAIFPVLESESSREEGEGEAPTETPAPPQRQDQFPRTHLIMSLSQLVDQGFPVPVKGPLKEKFRNYVLTKDLYKEVSASSPMFALDCEMCMTTAKNLELTRVSVVDENLTCLYDQLVLPYNRIVNYLTQYSGITRAMLMGVTKRLEDVQQDLRQMLPMDAILVGQSLNSDLHALRMMHPYVIDTSVIFNVTGNYKRKTKLSVLSLKFLGEQIQCSASGHCPTEDSEACMKLVQLKLANTPAFGDTVLASCHPPHMSQLQSISPSAPPSPRETPDVPHLATTMFSYFNHHHKSVAIVSTRPLAEEYSKWMSARLGEARIHERPTCVATERVAATLAECAHSHALALGHAACDPAETQDPERNVRLFRRVDRWCARLLDRAADRALCVVLFGGRDGGANGVGFIQLKQADQPHRQH